MTDPLPFAEWARELQAELEETRQAITEATSALHEAETTCAVAEKRHAAIRQAIAALPAPPAYAIAAKARGADEAWHDTRNDAARAAAHLASLRARCADLEQAQHELLLMTPPETIELEDVHAA